MFVFVDLEADLPAEPLGVFIRNSWRSLLIAANMNTQQHIPGGDQDSEIDNSLINYDSFVSNVQFLYMTSRKPNSNIM